MRETNAIDDQGWFWTPEWQAGEREADTEIAAGHVTFYGSTTEFLAVLQEQCGASFAQLLMKGQP